MTENIINVLSMLMLILRERLYSESTTSQLQLQFEQAGDLAFNPSRMQVLNFSTRERKLRLLIQAIPYADFMYTLTQVRTKQ